MKNFFLLILLTFNFHIIAQNNGEQLVKNYLANNFEKLGLQKSDIASFIITDDYVSGTSKIRHIYISQVINGVTIQNGNANFTLNSKDSIVHVSSRLIANCSNKFNQDIEPSFSAKKAIKYTAKILEIKGKAGKLKDATVPNKFVFEKGKLSLEDITVRLNLWDSGEKISLVYIVSIYEKSKNHWWQIFIDAKTRKELNRLDWVSQCSPNSFHQHTTLTTESCTSPLPASPPPGFNQYNVFALPVESPNHGNRTIEIDPANPTASPFGWHDDNGVIGEEYTYTNGNNVYAYEDTDADDLAGYSPDGGADLNFDFNLDLSADPLLQKDAAITNLFFVNNRIHDIMYQNGFDEVSGNFQSNNYGNGGAEFDQVFAEAQDGSGTNNANFATPPDGENPRMQMYLWENDQIDPNLVTVNSPMSISGTYAGVIGLIGPSISTSITSDLVLAIDDTDPINDACEFIVNANEIDGKIAIVYRGTCTFATKVENLQALGALAVIVINNVPGNPFGMGGATGNITIPSLMVSDVVGQMLVDALNSENVNLTLNANTGVVSKTDSDFDNGIIVHEFAHGISTRLTGGPMNSDCLNNDEQMGEGWSDFFALMLTMNINNPNPVYRPMSTYVNFESPQGNGIRNVPYDTSFLVNNYTYASVSDEVNISLPHGIGFIWATMLWDLNWALIDQYGFDANIETGVGGNNMALKLVTEALKIQPCNPGFVDGRDAILVADQLLYGGANECLIWKVFAKRGLGYNADQGSSFDRTDQVESFSIPPNCQIITSPPTANFTANVTTSCSGLIDFVDNSTENTTSWSWNFGDGSTSVEENPSHQYLSPGIYTVTLTAINNLGSDDKVRTNYIEIVDMEVTNIVNGFGCPNDSILLSATGSGILSWKDNSGTVLGTGSSFYTEPSNQSSSYFVSNTFDYPNYYIGPMDSTIGTGSNHNTSFIGAINFEASNELTIVSALVYSGAVGTRTIQLWDQFNSQGNVVQTIDVDVPFVGEGRINLGFNVPAAGQYSLGLDSADFYRNNSGTIYPFEVPNLMKIVSSSAGNNSPNYYYFYNIEISRTSCESALSVVNATVETIDFSHEILPTGVQFIDLTANATSWLWNFGDGTTSINQNPLHTFEADGVYNVSLQVNNGDCTYSQEVTLIGLGINLDESNSSDFVSLFPNPTSKEVTLNFGKKLENNLQIEIVGVDGRIVLHSELNQGESKFVISCEQFVPQVYYVNLKKEDKQIRKKLVVM